MNKKEITRKQYTFTIHPNIKKCLEISAKQDRKSMSSVLEDLIVEHLEKKGVQNERQAVHRRIQD